jgi:3-hydroxyisobutyrate dehydrogenase-like beta-hydroxyacid dehydrogenase
MMGGLGMGGQRIGIVGVGNMGGRIARRIIDSGSDLTGYDRDPDRPRAAGVPAAASLPDLVRSVDVILLSLPDSSVIEPVVLGADGVRESCRTGQVVVDLSTASPQSSVRISEELAEAGVDFVDAGISGGARAAEAGTLTVMAGGPPGALDRIRPVLESFSSRVFHMGPSGSGHTAKLLNNFLNAVSLAATAEVMVAARRAGLDLVKLLDVVNASSGVNYATLNRFPSIVRGDYLEGGLTGALMAKDVRLYLEHLARLGVPSLTGPACLAAFELTNSLGYGGQISNRVVDGIGDLAGGIRLYDPPANRNEEGAP